MSGVRREYALPESQTVLRRVRDRSRNLRATENASAPRLTQNHRSLELSELAASGRDVIKGHRGSNCSGRLELLALVNARSFAWVSVETSTGTGHVVDGEQSKARPFFCPTKHNVRRSGLRHGRG
jgi:hypothetical protein